MQCTDRRSAATCCTRGGAEVLATRSSCRLLSWKSPIHFALTCGIVLALAAPTGVASAEEDEAPRTVLTLQEALDRALTHNKHLAAYQYRITEQQGRVEQAGLLPNPQLDVFIEDAAGSGRYEGFDSAQTTISLGWVLEGWVRAGRVRAAQAGAELISAEVRVLRIEVAADTAEQFLASLASQTRLERADVAIALAEQTVAAVTRRVRAGKAPTAELARAEAELATDRLSRDDVTHELSVAYHRLAAQWGNTEPQFSHVGGELLTLPSIKPYEALTTGLERTPQLERYTTEERLAKANLRLAEARRWPALKPLLGVRRYEATDDTAIVAGVTVALPLLNRNQGEVAESRASISRARAQGGAARVRLQTTLFEFYEELQHYFHRAETLRNEVIPRLAEALEGTRQAYERGRYGYFELRSVQADLLRAESDLVEASVGAHRLVIALERLTGERVVEK
jgi:cobalt-zinc-cadmium efflux system outer membrane protein